MLFDGSEASLKNWTTGGGKPTRWTLVDGALESVKGGGYAQTVEEFGSCRLHIEFATPPNRKAADRDAGTAASFSWANTRSRFSTPTKTPPIRTASAAPSTAGPSPRQCLAQTGEWQTYDITFHRPLFDENGKVVRKAKLHVVHNGWVIQDNVELSGGTGWNGPHSISEYRKHGDTGPLKMQDHGNPVRFRNIWIQKIED